MTMPKTRMKTPSLERRARSPRGFWLRRLVALRYRLEISGLENIPADRPALFLPNHPSLLDPFIVYACLDGLRPRFIADENQFTSPLLRWVERVTRVITIPDYNVDGPSARAGVLAGLDEAALALRRGESIILFPAGGTQRSTDDEIRNTSSVSRILRAAPEARAVGVRICGMWGSSFSRAPHGGEKPDFMLMLKAGAKAILANLIFFTPRRRLRISFVDAADMPRPDGDAAPSAVARRAVTGWLNNFYAPTRHAPVFVPRYFWQSRA